MEHIDNTSKVNISISIIFLLKEKFSIGPEGLRGCVDRIVQTAEQQAIDRPAGNEYAYSYRSAAVSTGFTTGGGGSTAYGSGSGSAYGSGGGGAYGSGSGGSGATTSVTRTYINSASPNYSSGSFYRNLPNESYAGANTSTSTSTSSINIQPTASQNLYQTLSSASINPTRDESNHSSILRDSSRDDAYRSSTLRQTSAREETSRGSLLQESSLRDETPRNSILRESTPREYIRTETVYHAPTLRESAVTSRESLSRYSTVNENRLSADYESIANT